MSTPSYAARDSLTMLRRNYKHALRYPSLTFSIIAMPVLLLLLFVGVFGGALGAGLGAFAHGGRYIDYVVPGILVMTITSGSMPPAVGIRSDVSEGIVDRFRTMGIAQGAMLTGHVVISMAQTLVSLVPCVGVALLLGYRPQAGVGAWLAVVGLVGLVTFAITWLSIALGLFAKTPESASNIVLPLAYLPFVGSAFVPPASMPVGVRWFAEYQPFTPIIETLRGLLQGTPIGDDGIVAVGWCVLIAVVGYLWGRRLFSRGPAAA